ncbi:MAG: type II toxin-antitoxin system HicB family antitoxin [Clostridia bacterium]|nr:type II toxin-antitoxin system HicB family antitoxin [Clostridia bacterium]
MQDYNILMAYDPKEKYYVTAVPALPGCMSDGHTAKEALENTDVIIQEWLDDAKENDEPIPEPDGRTVTLVASLDRLFELIKKEGTT